MENVENNNIESNPEQEEANKVLKETMDNMTPPEEKPKDKLAFAPVILNDNEEKTKAIKDQLAIDQELQRKVKDNEDIYESELKQLKNYGSEWMLKGVDPVGINEVIFNPDTIYKIGNRIISPAGIQLITDDIMNCALNVDSGAIKNEKKIFEVGGGTMEVHEHGGVTLVNTKI